jgi:hypothetical protein
MAQRLLVLLQTVRRMFLVSSMQPSDTQDNMRLLLAASCTAPHDTVGLSSNIGVDLNWSCMQQRF